MMTVATFFRKSFLSREPLYNRITVVDMRRSRRRRLKCSAALRYLRIATESVMNGCQHRGWVAERAASSPWLPSSPLIVTIDCTIGRTQARKLQSLLQSYTGIFFPTIRTQDNINSQILKSLPLHKEKHRKKHKINQVRVRSYIYHIKKRYLEDATDERPASNERTQRFITSAACFFQSPTIRLSLIEKELRRNTFRFVSDRRPAAGDNMITRLSQSRPHEWDRIVSISGAKQLPGNLNIFCLVIRNVRMVLMTRHGIPRAQQRKSPLLLHSTQETL